MDNNNIEKHTDYDKLVNNLRDLFKAEYHNHQDLYLRQDYDRVMQSDNRRHCGRYLDHCHMDLEKAFNKMRDTLKWRKKNNIDQLTCTRYPKEFWHFNIFAFCGRDKEGSLMLYLLARKRDYPRSSVDKLVKEFYIYYIELIDSSLKDGEKLHLVYDATGLTMTNSKIEYAIWLIKTCLERFPCMYKTISFVGMSPVIKPILKVVLTYVPKRYKDIVTIGTLDELVVAKLDADQLPWFYGGSLDQTCMLAPTESKWAKDLNYSASYLKDIQEFAYSFVSQDDRDLLTSLQNEKEDKSG